MVSYIITDEDTGEKIRTTNEKDAEKAYLNLREQHPLHTANLVKYIPDYKTSKINREVIYSTI